MPICAQAMVKSPLALGTKGSFLQLSRRDKDPSLVPRNANSEEEGDDDSAAPPEPTPSFITQARCHIPLRACATGLQCAAHCHPTSPFTAELRVDHVEQVTTRNGIGAAKAGEAPAISPAASEAVEPRATWRHRVRSLLCCLAPPATDHYYRSSETEAVVVRRPAQPVPAHHFTGSPVIGPMSPGDVGKKTLVLDLDETLVHSSFKPIPNPDYIIPVRRPCCTSIWRCLTTAACQL